MSKSKNVRLSTNRLELIAITLDHVCAELESPECLAALLNVLVEPERRPGEYDRDAQEFFRDPPGEGGTSVVGGWYGWYTVRRAHFCSPPVYIGAGGYFGPPGASGVVEIGFSIKPAWQSHGYATELAGMLIDNAFKDIRVEKIIAHASPMNIASRRVLEKSGFDYVCENEESGDDLYTISRNISA
jgi:RimJ/RimL family protein N-acetyltransferase